uniref:dolichyl-phosphate-mannose--protein mannosyltransferase n=1 Tax=Ascaris suum TaxID=6253 RepID=F1KX31_ASCSU
MKHKVSSHRDTGRSGEKVRSLLQRTRQTSHHIPLLLVLSTICFSTNISGDFVFDDTEAIVKNPIVRDSNRWLDVLTSDFWGRPIRSEHSHKSYRPITTLTFIFNRIFFGLDTTPYHIFNVLLHSIVTTLVYKATSNAAMLFDGTCTEKLAFHAALLFAVHPVHSEAVANIVGRAELLMAMFALLTVNVYIECLKMGEFTLERKCTLLALSLLALFSKEQGIIALPLCASIDLLASAFSITRLIRVFKQSCSSSYRNNRSKNDNNKFVSNDMRCLLRVLLCTFATMGMLLIRLYINGFKSPKFSSFDNPIASHPSAFFRLFSYCYLIVLNIWLLVNPSKLCFDYSMGCITPIESVFDRRFCLTISIVIVIIILLYRRIVNCLAWSRLTYFGFSIAILAFLPASNFFLTVGFVLAERVLYLPSVGFCILVAIVYDKLKTQISDHSKNEMVRFAACIILLLGVNKSMERCSEWRTELDLYRSGLVVCPTNAKIHYNLGKVLADSGDSLTAEVSYKSAIRLNPSYDHAMNNLANIYLVRGQYSEAEKLLKKCVQIRSGFAAAWMNLGLAMLGQRKFKESEECFRMSLSIRPNYPDCLYNLGNLYLQQNKKRLAESIWRNVTRIQMDHERAWVNLLVLLDELDDCEEVIELADSALEYLDDRASIHFQLGTCFGKMAQFGNAEKHLRKAVDLQRDNALYWTNLGILYQRWNRTENAIEAYRMTLTLQPASQTAKDNLGKLAHKLN